MISPILKLRFSLVKLRFCRTAKGCCSLHRQRTGPVIALARNLHVRRSRVLARLTAVFIASLRRTLAGNVCTSVLIIRPHHCSPFLISFQQLLKPSLLETPGSSKVGTVAGLSEVSGL